MAEDKKDAKSFPLENPKAPPVLLAVGAFLWKLIATLANVDFVLSMREEKITTLFQFLLQYGWAIIGIVGIVWALQAHKYPEKGVTVHWGMVTSVGIIAFMFGALSAAYSSGSMPNVIVGWTGAVDGCSALIDTSKLIGFKGKYHLFLSCQIFDPTVDALENPNIALSSPFNIDGGGIQIIVPYAPESAIKGLAKPGTTATKFTVVLLPKDQDVSKIKRLSDVPKEGGILVIPGTRP
jgi:hypothetical protein